MFKAPFFLENSYILFQYGKSFSVLSDDEFMIFVMISSMRFNFMYLNRLTLIVSHYHVLDNNNPLGTLFNNKGCNINSIFKV